MTFEDERIFPIRAHRVDARVFIIDTGFVVEYRLTYLSQESSSPEPWRRVDGLTEEDALDVLLAVASEAFEGF